MRERLDVREGLDVRERLDVREGLDVRERLDVREGVKCERGVINIVHHNCVHHVYFICTL